MTWGARLYSKLFALRQLELAYANFRCTLDR